MGKKVIRTGKWVIVRRIHRGAEHLGAISKIEEHKYEANIKEWELLKRGTHKEIVATDVGQYSSTKDLTAEDIANIQEDPDTIVMNMKKPTKKKG